MTKALLVALGGGLGSVLRWAMTGWFHRVVTPGSVFPWGTLVVNTVGCFSIGFLAGLTELRPVLSPQTRALLLVGLLGGFTTFSTFGYESFGFMRSSQLASTALNVGLNVVLGLVAVWIGHGLSRLL